jgi:IPT/TIG domain-containing protein/putative pyrroloquinoline-quinone-binding quinoprotein
MTQILRNAFIFLLVAASAAAQPTITVLSPATASRSSRVLIQGFGFGSLQGNGHVTIAGVTAPLTRWSDTLISAYVPEGALSGTGSIQVFNSTGAASNLVPITVTARQALTGHTKWRFQVDGDYIQGRPAVASDGTVYTQDVYGHLYALDPTGGLKWIFNATRVGFGEISVGLDGTIYSGSTDTIFALNPNGSIKWQFNQSPGAFIMLGPNVGPDGNIYAVGTQGMGVFSLTPQGTLRWSNPELYDRPIVTRQEIMFSTAQSRLYFHANRHLRSVGFDGSDKFNYADGLDTIQGDQQPAIAPDGSVYTNLFSALGPGLMLGKFDFTGNQLWHIFDQFPNSTNILSTVDVGPDGTVYDGRNLIELYAINPNGTQRWKYIDPGILFGPVVSPLNDLLLIGGLVNYGQPGFFEAVSTTGTFLWKHVLPVENGLNIVPMSRARFTADGQTAYFGMSIPGQGSDAYSYLYSVQTSSNSVVSLSLLTLNPTSVVGSTTSTGTVTLSGPAPSGGAVVSLSSAKPTVAAVLATVTVSAGLTTATFKVTTGAVATATVVAITGSYAGVSKSANITVTPPTVASLSLSPTTVKGGSSSTGKVTINGPAPAGGLLISLSSSNASLVTVPSSVTVAARATSATFTAQTKAPLTTTAVTISATKGSIVRRATLTVTP